MAEQKIVAAEQVAGYGPSGCGVVAIENGQRGQSLGMGDDGELAWIDCCVDVTQNADGTITIQVRYEDAVIVHPPMQVTFNDGGGNTFDAATQRLNIDFPFDVLLESSAFDAATGVLTMTMNNGDVHAVDLSTFWPVHADQVSVVGNGTAGNPLTGYQIEQTGGMSYVVTRPDGSTFTLTMHPAALLTNNAAAFSWNASSQTGNIPQVTKAVLNGAGDELTITFGDGSGSVTVPVCDDCHPAAGLTNNQAAFSWNAATQTGNIPQVTKAVLNGDGSLTITFGDGSGSVTLPAPSGGATHPAAAVTYTDAAYSWDAATQVLNIPRLNLTRNIDLANQNQPTLSADRTVLNIPPPLFARRESAALNVYVAAGGFQAVTGLATVSVDTTGSLMTGGSADYVIAPVDGWYTLHGSVGTDDLVNENEVLMALLTVDGAYATRGNAQPGQISGLYNAPVATLPWHYLVAGVQVGVAAHTNKVGGLFINSAFVGMELKRAA